MIELPDIIDSLVADREFSDVLKQNEKGVYRVEDLNRVESAVAYLKSFLEELQHPVDIHDVKTDWEMIDIPDLEQMTRYLENIAIVRGSVPLLPDTPKTPGDMDCLTYQEANNIEQILLNAYTVGENQIKAQIYAGQITSDLLWARGYVGSCFIPSGSAGLTVGGGLQYCVNAGGV